MIHCASLSVISFCFFSLYITLSMNMGLCLPTTKQKQQKMKRLGIGLHRLRGPSSSPPPPTHHQHNVWRRCGQPPWRAPLRQSPPPRLLPPQSALTQSPLSLPRTKWPGSCCNPSVAYTHSNAKGCSFCPCLSVCLLFPLLSSDLKVTDAEGLSVYYSLSFSLLVYRFKGHMPDGVAFVPCLSVFFLSCLPFQRTLMARGLSTRVCILFCLSGLF